MIKSKYVFTSFIFVLLFAFTGCASDKRTIEDLQNALDSEKFKNESLDNKVTAYAELIDSLKMDLEVTKSKVSQREAEIAKMEGQLNRVGPVSGNHIVLEALKIMDLLKNKDADSLAAFISPTNGVRFSPYSTVDLSRHIVFSSQDDIINMFENTSLYDWGNYDGTGDAILLSFNDYYSRFIYDAEFLNAPFISVNTFSELNQIHNNINEIYPGHAVVEFHFSGFDPLYNGMDWKSLILVFETSGDMWYLVGIIHSEWTI
ncbi:MAG: hypothetical protein JXI43_04865 [Tissierellales bacterium]|nr:hypothetical protein [Tissierellales bacterium]